MRWPPLLVFCPVSRSFSAWRAFFSFCVIFSSYSGTEVKIDGDAFLIMTEEEILGVVE